MTTAVTADSSYAYGPVSRPISVRWLFALLLADIAVGLVTIATCLILARGPGDWGKLFYPAAIVVAIPTAIEIPLAFAIRRGRRWASIIQLMLAVAALPFVWDVVLPTGFDFWSVASVVSSAVQVAIVVLLIVRPTRTFVQLHRRARR